MVEESNIFILYISNISGTYLKDEGRTVTHLEYLKAYRGRKIIIVYVEKGIMQSYFSKVKTPLADMVDEFCNKSGSLPKTEDLLTILETMADKLPPKEEVDYYTWVFIRHLLEKKVYCENIKIGVGN